jgi:hypothetical protein
MGMIIDKATGDQFGRITPPTESADGKLTGGAIIKGDPPTAIALENYTNAVFTLKVEGQTGVEGREFLAHDQFRRRVHGCELMRRCGAEAEGGGLGGRNRRIPNRNNA